MYKFKLRFKPSQIKKLAAVYDYKTDERIIKTIVPRIKRQSYINKKDFLEICEWKTQRTKSRCNKNSEDFIREVTGAAIRTKNEKLKIEILTLLEGVNWPTASTILHFISEFKYPVLDFRALWSLNYKTPPRYNFDFWNAYTLYCRKTAEKNNVTLRIFDKALWQYSAENQP